MKTWWEGNERITTIEDPRIEEGHEVFYHELRGYDSPDRWHEVFLHGEKIAELGAGHREREKAIAMCQRGPKTCFERLMEDDQVPQDPEAE